MQRSGKRIAVIGGGIGGVSAAWSLARSGFDVQRFERGRGAPCPLSRENTMAVEDFSLLQGLMLGRKAQRL